MNVQIKTGLTDGLELLNFIDHHNLEDASIDVDFEDNSLVFTL